MRQGHQPFATGQNGTLSGCIGYSGQRHNSVGGAIRPSPHIFSWPLHPLIPFRHPVFSSHFPWLPTWFVSSAVLLKSAGTRIAATVPDALLSKAAVRILATASAPAAAPWELKVTATRKFVREFFGARGIQDDSGEEQTASKALEGEGPLFYGGTGTARGHVMPRVTENVDQGMVEAMGWGVRWRGGERKERRRMTERSTQARQGAEGGDQGAHGVKR